MSVHWAQLPPNMQSKIVETPCPISGLRGPCWTWTGATQSRGYGSVGYGGKTHLTHRLAYQLLVGEIPQHLQLDHLCRNQRCCNPAHLEPVTGKVNCERSEAATKNRCVHGHPLAGPNVRTKRKPGGGAQRQCVVCEIDMRHRQTTKSRRGLRTPSKAWAVRREAKREALITAGEAALAVADGVAS